jgi:maltose alpha-D-glucosyltransferase/alpha-amylase
MEETRSSFAIAVLESLVPHESSGWVFTLDSLTSYYEEIKTHPDDFSRAKEYIGEKYLEAVRILGKRTAEMHIALTTHPEESSFQPEAFSILYQRSLYQMMRGKLQKVFRLLKKQLPYLPENQQGLAQEVLQQKSKILNLYEWLIHTKLSMMRIRIHGDYHLGQVLYQGKDFCVIDFEGAPLLSIGARRMKHSPLVDVASMLRSFQYAAYQVLYFDERIPKEKGSQVEKWMMRWYEEVKNIFLEAYMEAMQANSIFLVSQEPKERDQFLQVLLLDKAVYELMYEINARPGWSAIPCKGILSHL